MKIFKSYVNDDKFLRFLKNMQIDSSNDALKYNKTCKISINDIKLASTSNTSIWNIILDDGWKDDKKNKKESCKNRWK